MKLIRIGLASINSKSENNFRPIKLYLWFSIANESTRKVLTRKVLMRKVLLLENPKNPLYIRPTLT